jgi:alpha-beta hydrolase superfamily lysophospholipase
MREWDARDNRAVIVALHGMSDYSESFDMPAPYWAQHGITTIAYDQRGFGRAPDPFLWGGAKIMRRDLDDCVEAAKRKFPHTPVFALGESMGGAVVLSALADPNPPAVRGVILVAPAVWSRADMPLSYRVILWLGAHTFPAMHLSGNGLGIQATDNLAVLRKLSHDPLFQHDARIDQIYGLANLMDQAREAPDILSAAPPILLLYGGHDEVIPAAPTRAVIASLGSRADVHFYPAGYHMLLRDLDGPKRWADVADWVAKNTN